MKKVMFASLVALALMLAGNFASAATVSWQEWYGWQNRLVVHVGDAKSAICFDGKREDYDGHCVTPAANQSAIMNSTSEYRDKLAAKSAGQPYVDTNWFLFFGKK